MNIIEDKAVPLSTPSQLTTLKVEDFLNLKNSLVDYNEIYITKTDILNIHELAQYIKDNNILFESNKIRLDSLSITKQNKIGFIYMKYYNLCITKIDEVTNNQITYLNYDLLMELFHYSAKLSNIIITAKNLTKQTYIENNETIINYLKFKDKDFNLLVLNFFKLNFRNAKLIDKYLQPTKVLMDINLKSNKFEKVTNLSEFLINQLNTFISTTKGSIPFCSDIGSNFKFHIHRKLDTFSYDLIKEDLILFFQNLNSIYSDSFKLLDIQIKEPNNDLNNYKLQVTILVQAAKEEPIQIEFV